MYNEGGIAIENVQDLTMKLITKRHCLTEMHYLPT